MRGDEPALVFRCSGHALEVQLRPAQGLALNYPCTVTATLGERGPPPGLKYLYSLKGVKTLKGLKRLETLKGLKRLNLIILDIPTI